MRIAIINSADGWKLGWATSPHTLQPVIYSLIRAEITVDVYNVDDLESLSQAVLDIKKNQAIAWVNAYQVNVVKTNNDEKVWLSDILEQHQVPYIGSNSQALQNVLAKHQCQHILTTNKVSIPYFTKVDADNINILKQLIMLNNLEFPLFVKPDALSSSMGISQDCIVYDIEQLKKQIQILSNEFGYPLMVEEYLPGDDITVAVINSGDEHILLPTYYRADNHETEFTVLDRQDRLQNWGGSKQMHVVTEPDILAQIPKVVLPACKALGISDVTRIDCRIDRHGKLKAFDVNGLPGLEYPDSVTVWQFITKFKNLTWIEGFDILINLIVYSAAKRNQMPIPPKVDRIATQYMKELQVIPQPQAELSV